MFRCSQVGVFWIRNSKGKGHPATGQEGPEGKQRYSSTLSLNLGARWSGWSTPRLGRLTSGNNPVPIVQEVTWAPWPVWTGAENLAPPGFDPRTVQPVAGPYTD
jgi:hypothetical protein